MVHFIVKLALVSAVIFFSIGVARFHTRAGALTAFINGFIVVMGEWVSPFPLSCFRHACVPHALLDYTHSSRVE